MPQSPTICRATFLNCTGATTRPRFFSSSKKAKSAEAKAFIRSFEHLVTSAAKQKADTADFEKNKTQHIFTGFYLTGDGYRYLGIADADNRMPKDQQFKDGMQKSAPNLGDTPTDWDAFYRQDAQGQGIHGMILLGFGGPSRAQLLERETFSISQQLTNHGLADVFVERGDGIKNDNGDDIEHFGYVDGISQPKFFREELNPDLATNWNPLASWDLVLEEDPGGTPGKSFGSYLVFRKLEQHVRDFKQTEQVLSQAIFGKSSELAGALIVGRFENGMPVTLSSEDNELNAHHNPPIPVSGTFVGKINDFTYGSDDKGARCPFHAHIRKSNPRGESERLGAPLDVEQAHTMARRGIIYGHRDVHPNKQEDLTKLPNGGVGLLFMSFQRVLSNQFEFIQQSWVNNDKFVQGFLPGDLPTGLDPVIGQGAFSPLMHRYARQYDNAATVGVLAGNLHNVPAIPARYAARRGRLRQVRDYTRGRLLFCPQQNVPADDLTPHQSTTEAAVQQGAAVLVGGQEPTRRFLWANRYLTPINHPAHETYPTPAAYVVHDRCRCAACRRASRTGAPERRPDRTGAPERRPDRTRPRLHSPFRLPGHPPLNRWMGGCC